MHRHISKHQKRRQRDAQAADLLRAALPRNGTVPLPVGRYERGVLMVATYWSGTVRSLDAARRVCRRAGVSFVEPYVQLSEVELARRLAEQKRHAAWRAAMDTSWAARKTRPT